MKESAIAEPSSGQSSLRTTESRAVSLPQVERSGA